MTDFFAISSLLRLAKFESEIYNAIRIFGESAILSVRISSRNVSSEVGVVGWLDFFMQDNDAKCLLSENALVKVTFSQWGWGWTFSEELMVMIVIDDVCGIATDVMMIPTYQ